MARCPRQEQPREPITFLSFPENLIENKVPFTANTIACFGMNYTNTWDFPCVPSEGRARRTH